LISAGAAETVGLVAAPERCTFGRGVGSSGFVVGFFVVSALPEGSGVGDATGESDGDASGEATAPDEVAVGFGEAADDGVGDDEPGGSGVAPVQPLSSSTATAAAT
jgi:hypothetical protein